MSPRQHMGIVLCGRVVQIAWYAAISTVVDEVIIMVEKLSESEIETGLEGLSDWSRSGDAIQRTYSFADFLGSIAFVNAIAARAEEVQHHPDILVRYAKVTLTLSTHDCGGLSEKDLVFAADSDRLYSG